MKKGSKISKSKSMIFYRDKNGKLRCYRLSKKQKGNIKEKVSEQLKNKNKNKKEIKKENKKLKSKNENTNKEIGVIKTGEEYYNKFIEAKNNMKKENPRAAWRVTKDYEEEDYDEMKLFSSKGGSVFAVKQNGDIVSVCKNPGDIVRGKDLLEEAVKQGGKKLDTYDGNYIFYRKCGFEPVSWTKFEEQWAPEGWTKGRDKPEPIVFFKYTGNKTTLSAEQLNEEKKKFYKENKALEYEKAQRYRDRRINNDK